METNFLKSFRFTLPLEKEQNNMIRQNTQSEVWPTQLGNINLVQKFDVKVTVHRGKFL